MIYTSGGHHVKDPGAVYGGRKEADEMRCFRTLVDQELALLGYETIPDKDSETAAQHQSRIKPGAASVVCEWHLNAVANTRATGTETVVKKNATANSIAMANEFNNVTSRILGIPNRGILVDVNTPRGRIGIVNKPGTVILHEVCFLSNPENMRSFDIHKVALAKAYAQILIKYENLI